MERHLDVAIGGVEEDGSLRGPDWRKRASIYMNFAFWCFGAAQYSQRGRCGRSVSQADLNHQRPPARN